ncbi:hypothetical protein F1737_07045 [Methanoplanus sp. FWC-SCC4]|uniref:Uncharacterized protein n=1 Tax=Methanochimaera problematica TaxID=2609417 RepID=A0AA97FDW1_9EURY|nr:hypothetical protein [Methanoplanus sp. FWC-SCC4]WOF16473.1 hypothetical protein F1737_07045 [Methanoplanus sp. FWC-SCC4]
MKIKKGMRAFCLLMVMIFVGAVFVPAVSAVDIENIEKYSVSQNNAFNGAKNELSKFINVGAMSKDDYSIEMLKNEPTLINHRVDFCRMVIF